MTLHTVILLVHKCALKCAFYALSFSSPWNWSLKDHVVEVLLKSHIPLYKGEILMPMHSLFCKCFYNIVSDVIFNCHVENVSLKFICEMCNMCLHMHQVNKFLLMFIVYKQLFPHASLNSLFWPVNFICKLYWGQFDCSYSILYFGHS